MKTVGKYEQMACLIISVQHGIAIFGVNGLTVSADSTVVRAGAER
jgi:hypothetical protein